MFTSHRPWYMVIPALLFSLVVSVFGSSTGSTATTAIAAPTIVPVATHASAMVIAPAHEASLKVVTAPVTLPIVLRHPHYPAPVRSVKITVKKHRPVIRHYRVRRGDTLTRVATNFHLQSWRVLWNANHKIKTPDLIYVGQVLRIPNGKTHLRPLPVHRRKQRATPPQPAPRPLPTPAPTSDPQHYAVMEISVMGWSDVSTQFECLDSLWNRESGWNTYADNPTSGAYGIPQSLPGDKMASAGSDWRTNPDTQIRWGLGYIKSSYGSPCGAWAHSEATGWY